MVRGHGEPEALSGASLSPWIFDLVGVRFRLGRGFLAQEETAPVAVLGYNLWQRRYAGDPAVVGQAIIVHDKPYTVIGVLPESFYFPLVTAAELFTPLAPPRASLGPGRTWASAPLGQGLDSTVKRPVRCHQ